MALSFFGGKSTSPSLPKVKMMGEEKYCPNDLPVLKPKLILVRSHKSPRAFLSPPQRALRLTWMMFIPQRLPLGLISLTMAISFSGSVSQDLSSVCLWHMHVSPPESRAEIWAGPGGRGDGYRKVML